MGYSPLVTASDSARALLMLLQYPRIGPATVRSYVACVSSSQSLNEFISRLHLEPSNVRQSFDHAGRIIDVCAALRISIVGLLDDNYPSALRRIPDAPPVIFVLGAINALHRTCIAVVGTRRASATGLAMATEFASALAGGGYAVVSGLALGIDAAAHRSTLTARGVTIAVLAHGLDSVAPTSHRELAAEIVNSGGALMSEHAPDVPARPPEFVRRNRLQSGLAIASVMVESGVPGGAIHQARFTHKQGRGLFVVMPSDSSQSMDYNREGAIYLTDTLGAIVVQTPNELLCRLSSMDEAARGATQLQGRLPI